MLRVKRRWRRRRWRISGAHRQIHRRQRWDIAVLRIHRRQRWKVAGLGIHTRQRRNAASSQRDSRWEIRESRRRNGIVHSRRRIGRFAEIGACLSLLPVVRIIGVGTAAWFARHQITRVSRAPIVRTVVFARNDEMRGCAEEQADGARDRVAVKVLRFVDAVVLGPVRAENIRTPIDLIFHPENLSIPILFARVESTVCRIVRETKMFVYR